MLPRLLRALRHPEARAPRVDPTFVPVVRIERDVGVPLISLIALTGQRSTPRRLRWPHYQAVAERGAGIGCLSGGRAFASSGEWDSGNPAFAISHGSRDAPALTPGPIAALLACDCSVHLSDPGKPSDPRTFPSSSSRLRRGYNRAPRGAFRFSVIRFPPRSWALLAVGLPGKAFLPGPRQGYRVPHA